MYDFQQYNSASPQIITSFKGNQKLILGGYRYNIHHVKEGVKTWRCVCAKKLTGARSWCKGRAETWDQDSKGIPKGEHNHQTEHDLAELEYFKSQLIFAAIADPQADLNVLIDDASKFLSDGLNFGNRESMKKSLIVARKSAESGELKLGQQPHRSTLRGGSKKCSVRSKAGGNASASLVPLPSATLRTLPSAKGGTAAVKNQQQLPSSTGPSSAPASTNKSSSSSASSQKQFGTSAASSSSFLLNSSSGSSGLGSSLGSDFSSESPGYPQNWQQMDISGMASFFEANCEGGAMASGAGSQYGANLGTSNEQLLAAAFFAAAMLGGTQQSQAESATATNSSATQKKSAAIQSNNAAGRSTTSHPSGTSKTHVSTPATHNNNANMKRKRVDGILQKLSSKAVAKISPSPPLPATSQQKEEAMELEKDQPSPAALEGKPKMVSVESQTEESALAEVKVAKKRRRRGSEEEEGEEKADLDGTGTCQRKVVCCCCADAKELAVDEMPPGCKKRARLLLMATEQQPIKSEPNNNERLKEEEGGREEGERTSSESEEGTAAVGEDLELFELDGEELKLEIADEEEVEEEERENIDD